MIDVNAKVKLSGTVSAVGTGEFTLSVKEFYLDGQWNRFVVPKEITVTTADYDNHLTSEELAFILDAAQKAQKSTNLCDDEREVVDSIVKKLAEQ